MNDKGRTNDGRFFIAVLFLVCKSCLLKHLEEDNTCPKCLILIHQSHPTQYISYDRTMQDIVYKLVPNLHEGTFFLLYEISLSSVI